MLDPKFILEFVRFIRHVLFTAQTGITEDNDQRPTTGSPGRLMSQSQRLAEIRAADHETYARAFEGPFRAQTGRAQAVARLLETARAISEAN